MLSCYNTEFDGDGAPNVWEVANCAHREVVERISAQIGIVAHLGAIRIAQRVCYRNALEAGPEDSDAAANVRTNRSKEGGTEVITSCNARLGRAANK